MTLDIPPMRPLGSARISHDLLDGHPSYATLLADAATTSCCPVWVSEQGMAMLEPAADPSAVIVDIERRDPAAFLADHWPRNCPTCGCRESFETFTGLAAPTTPGANPIVVATHGTGQAHLVLAPASRPADAVAVLGWRGTCNRHDDVTGLSAVLRSWEDRFGAVLVKIDFMTLWLSVAAPPLTAQECRAVAAEHFAFCPDVDSGDPRPLRHYAATLAGRSWWRFWWD